MITPLTLVASIWGMNVGVPGEGSRTAFWAIIAALVVMLVGLLYYFRRRGLL